MTEKDKLLDEALLGEALIGLRTHHGWKALIRIFQDLYTDALEKLVQNEDVEARATVKVLQDIMDKIDGSVRLSAQSREQYNKRLEQDTE